MLQLKVNKFFSSHRPSFHPPRPGDDLHSPVHTLHSDFRVDAGVIDFRFRHKDSEHLLLRFHTGYSEFKVCNSIFDFSAWISQLASRISQLASRISQLAFKILGIQFSSFSDFSASILSIQVLIFSQGASQISHRYSDFRHSATSILHSQSVTPISHRNSDFSSYQWATPILPVSNFDFTYISRLLFLLLS